MAFDYPVNLELAGRPCLLAGSGPLAVERLGGLRASDAEVTVVTPAASPELAAAVAEHGAVLHERSLTTDDLDGVFLAIVTREDEHDVPALYAAARERGVLFAALDDVAHCDFGAMSQLRRGDLRLTVSSAGRAPALAKRLRKRLEAELAPELGELVEVIDEVKRAHGPRQVPFAVWAARWEVAMEDLDGLLALLADGDREAVHARVLAALRTPAPDEPAG